MGGVPDLEREAGRGAAQVLMSNGEIKEAMESGELGIDEYILDNLQPASYDLRLGDQALLSGQDKIVKLDTADSISISPGQFVLLMTKEHFRMPLTIVGQIGPKGDLARKGLILLSGLQIDPGFEGVLVLGAYNASPRRLILDYLDAFATVEFHKLAKASERGHRGIPALRKGLIPDEAKDYLRQIETASLSELSESVRTLSENMSTLTTVTYKVILPILLAIFAAAVASVLF